MTSQTSEAKVQLAIHQLQDKSSAKRRAAAKALRKQKVPSAGPELLSALQREIANRKTWETQYQIIMAIAECGYTKSLNYLVEISAQDLSAPMVYVAIGDAITRLNLIETGDANSSISVISNTENKMLIDGMIRAIAMLRLVPHHQHIEAIIDFGNSLDIDDNTRTWIAAASAGWKGKSVDGFLTKSLKSTNQQTKRAALASIESKYLKWNPL
jgi:HEAT repeat protein